MTTRREILLALAVAVLSGPIESVAQRAGKVHRIGHLSGSAESASKPFMDAFRLGLRELGYVEKQNVTLEERYADGKVERLPLLAQELIARGCDVLLVSTTPGNLAAKAATTTIPIVMVLVADPVGAGIVSNLQRPGGNVTGVTNIVAELTGKRLQILKEILPGASRIAVFVNPNDQNAPLQMRMAETAARQLKLELRPVHEIRTAVDLKSGFEAAARSGANGILRMVDPLVFMLRTQTADLAAQYRLPMMHVFREDVEAGGLVAYGANVSEQYRQAATLIDKILKGAKPGDLPVEQPLKFELAVNLKTAKALGISIPQSLVLRADKVID